MARETNRHVGDRLELLLFHLGGRQRFGINVLKVKEVIACPPLTQIPGSHPAVRGVAHLRGEPLTVIELSSAIGRPSLYADARAAREGTVIITEFNRNMQGFLVERVDRIVLCDWKSVLPPPRGTGAGSYITGVTEIEKSLVEILDVEKVIGEVTADDEAPVGITAADEDLALTRGARVMVVDDSSVARHQTVNTLEPLGITCILARDGLEALELLRKLNSEASGEAVDMVISDIEMPEMDGYTLTREIRKDNRLAGLYTLLHTSLNGAVNIEKAQKAGADAVLTKFVPDELARAVIKGMRERCAE